MTVNVGIVGLGVISKFYAAALGKLSNPALVAVCDLAEARMQVYQQQGVACYRDYHDLLSAPQVDAVVVNVPNDLHFAICRSALMAGKHVCCEKPLTLSLREAEELTALSRQTGRTLFTAFHRRYNVNFQHALAGIHDRSQIAWVNVRYLERIEDHSGDDRWYLEPARCGGGCVADNGPNVFDTLAYFLGHLEVTGATLVRDAGGIDTEAHISLSAGSIPVTVQLDWGYEHGECKDLTVGLHSGEEIYVDMLDGFKQFKSSLYHEYEAILTDFVSTIAAGNAHGDAGVDAVRLVTETYASATAFAPMARRDRA